MTTQMTVNHNEKSQQSPTTTSWTAHACPHCGSTVQVPEKGLGKMVTCPEPGCGRQFLAEIQQDLQTAPDQSALLLPEGLDRDEPPETPMATPAAVPAIPVAQVENPEEFRVNLVMFRRYPLRWIGYCLLALAGLVALSYAVAYQSLLLTLLGLVGLIFAGYRLVVWWFRVRYSVLLVTPEECILETGYLNKKVTTVKREQITDVHVQQHWLSWLMDVGDLVIVAKNGEEPAHLVLLGVQAPAQVAERIHRKVAEPAA